MTSSSVLSFHLRSLAGEVTEAWEVTNHDEATRLFLLKADTIQSFDLVIDWFRSQERKAVLHRDHVTYTFEYMEEPCAHS